MYKELIICILIVFCIFALDYISQSYTKKSVETIMIKIEEIKEESEKIDKEDENKIISKMDDTFNIWNKHQKILAIYIEHNELEKVEANFVECKSFIEQKDYVMAINSIDKTIFSLNHLTDKYSLNIINIF